MALSFGDISSQSKNVCFQVPDLNIPKFKGIGGSNIEKLKLPDFLNSALAFGKKLENNIKSLNLPKISGRDLKFGLDFGGLPSIDDKIRNLKLPTTFCITLGGGFGFDSIFTQLTGMLDGLPKLEVSLPTLPDIGLASLIPPIFVDIKLPINLNLTQALDAIKNNCINSIMNALRGLDPFERLRRLLEIAAELCAAMEFSKLKAVIDQIQQAQMELIQQALNAITDPIAKLAKLIDMAVDAFQSGAYDLLEEISKLINGVKFDALIKFLEDLDPTVALAALVANIRNLVQLKNFAPIQQLLTAIQIIKNKLQGALEIPAGLLSLPELGLDAIQNEINRLLDIDDFLGIQQIMAQVQRLKDQLILNLRALSPAALLGQIPALLQDALQKLDMSQYSQILQEAGSKLCEDIASLVPTLPEV